MSAPLPSDIMAERAARLADQMSRLQTGGGGGTSEGMDSRVTKLETHMEYVRDDLREIKGDLKAVVLRLNELPTKKDLDTWRWQWMGIGIAIVALTVGGITGGLALISKFAS